MGKKAKTIGLAALLAGSAILTGYTLQENKKITETFNAAHTCRTIAANIAQDDEFYKEGFQDTATKRSCTMAELKALSDVRASLDAEGTSSPYYARAKATGFPL